MERSEMMSVRTELVVEQLVDRVVEAGIERVAQSDGSEEVPSIGDVEISMRAAGRPLGAAVSEVAVPLARNGYAGRAVELSLFEVARAPIAWLSVRPDGERAAGTSPSEAASGVAATLAAEEPDGRPDPSDGTGSWRVPGPGGHVRHYVALRSATLLVPEPQRDRTPEEAGDFKRCWLYGFFLAAVLEQDALTESRTTVREAGSG